VAACSEHRSSKEVVSVSFHSAVVRLKCSMLMSCSCVGCQKYFGSSSALIQHQESGACYIARPEAFVAADRATGGLASVAREAGGWEE